MNRGAKYLLASVALTAGCANQPAIKLRALPDPLAAARKPGNPVLGEARAMLALGDVGTAIEGFRQAQREQPDSIEPLAGLAECYDRMGRFDVSRQYYEAALAIAPRNPVLLNAFATSLARGGRTDESVAVRAEAMAALHSVQLAVAPRREVAAATVTVPLPVPKPVPSILAVKPVKTAPSVLAVKRASRLAPAIAAAAPAMAAPAPAPAAPPRAVPAPAPVAPAPPAIPAPMLDAIIRLQAAPAAPLALRPVNIASAVAPVLAAEPQPTPRPQPTPAAAPAPLPPAAKIPTPMLGAVAPLKAAPAAPIAPRPVKFASFVAAVLPSEPQVTATPAIAPAKAAPAARTVPPMRLAEARTVTVPAPEPATPIARAPIPPAQVRVANAPAIAPASPHLERMSLGEVALVSAPGPVWSSAPLAQAHQSLAVRFVPLNMAMERPAIQLLNAARSDRLAANTRSVLVARGWREMAIGDAPHTRDHSLVLYPAERQSLGLRVARQFGIASAVTNRSTKVVVLLGRDMAAIRAARQRG
jgi:hypothetical protein